VVKSHAISFHRQFKGVHNLDISTILGAQESPKHWEL
jgi:hypothetical protein